MSGAKTTMKVGTKPQTLKSEAKFSIEKLRANCRKLFGVSSCVFAGATAGMTGEYTIEEIKTHIEKWRRKEVK